MRPSARTPHAARAQDDALIRFTPERAGAFTFNRGMNMSHGKLIVED